MKLKISDFNDVHLYNSIIVEFCEVFDIELFSDQYFYQITNKKLENARNVKPAFIEKFSPLKKDMMKYQQEKYAWKSSLKIAAYQNLNVNDVLQYLNSIKDTIVTGDYKYLDDNGNFTETSKVKAISSFKIQKDVQNINRMNLLKSNLFQ